MNEAYGHIGALAVVLVWGTTFVSSKVLLLAGLPPADIFFIRFAMAYLFLLLFNHKQLWANSVADELTLLGLGILGGSLYFLAENVALIYSTTANVSILVCSCPIWTALLLAIFYQNERLNRLQSFASVLAFVGVVMVVLNGHFNLHLNPKGDALALLAALTWAFYSLLMRRIMNRYPSVFITRKVFFYGMITILPYYALQPWQVSVSMLLQAKVIGNLLFLGIVASTGCFLLWTWVMKRLGAVRASNYIYLQTFVTMVAGALVLAEPVSLMAVLGACIIIVGTILMQK